MKEHLNPVQLQCEKFKSFCPDHFRSDATLLAICIVIQLYLIYILIKVYKIIKLKNKAIIGMLVILCLEMGSKILFYSF